MSCTLETKLRTLDLDTASSHCPLLSPSYQAPAVHSRAAKASASSIPGQLSHHSTGWHRARHKRPQDHWRRFNQVPHLVR